ncbi:hypothetical protein P378_04610 [Desulforamulus profundi]|uniref:Aminopeptidase n=1 Tax=Desulforamulus profundi TaxID=1383067 RepID=A0A2C6MIH5_9FIRM|nr:aminopeptidase [Desulforamulus profundi]PHJ39266.1 hypothetical protein P378_04610 [Desulforamulus profundi]
MNKVKQNLIDALSTGREPVTGVLVAYQFNRDIAEKIAQILPFPVQMLDATRDVSVLEMINGNYSHVIELYHPAKDGYSICKQLRNYFWDRGYKTLSLFDWAEEYLQDDFWGDTDYPKLAADIAELRKKMHRARRFKITSEQGTNISFSTEGRRWLDAGGLSKNGSISQMPDGEIYTCPVEETFNGVIVVDGTVTRSWIPSKPVRLEFSGGKLIDCSKEFREYIQGFPEAIKTIGEFAIGLNPAITTMVGNISVDEKAAGTVHFALGDSYGLGINKCGCHLDFVVRRPLLHMEPKIEIPFMNVRELIEESL